jgi:diaminopimelate epimerase
MEVIPVSTGNPHSVSFVPDVQKLDLNRIGPLAEHHPSFPKRVNAHWAQVISPRELRMRTWERGSGITWACGTGASAVCVAGVLTGRSERKVLIHLPGGDLNIEWRESDNNIYMTGPATEVFSGEWNG